MVDEDSKRTIDSALAEFERLRASIREDTRRNEPEKYYDVWEFNNQFGKLWLSMVLGGKVPRDSILVTGFTMMQSKAYTIHELIVEGKYFTALREMRHLLEFAKRAAELDYEMKGRSVADKITEYEAREAADMADFRGGGLLKALEGNLGLTGPEVSAIKTLFGRLSSYAHGSAAEVKPFTLGNSAKPGYVRDLFDLTHDHVAAVTDVYLLLLCKFGMIDRSVITIPSNLSSLLPLSYPYLK
ncbi:MAG: hypothetical protein JRN54_07940 [Nitrososphaerota archaeon]|nr:hypothetical protein [Nitrososphaerota archaeon]